MAEHPVHAMKETAGGKVSTRCGENIPHKNGVWTAWESLVTCPACVAQRSPAQQNPRASTRTLRPDLDSALTDAFHADT